MSATITTPKFTSLQDIQTALHSGALTVEATVSHYLERIAATRPLNAYVEVFEEEALSRARKLDQKIKSAPDTLGSLVGLVVSIKDVICYKDHQVTGGSKILEGFESLFSSTAVERLLAEDAIIIGRTNCDEFAMGSTNENSFYGPVLNGANPQKVPGGSSGGAAVAVQTDTCLVALGSDTGGSVRQPAAFCGVIGFKPSYGRISRHGLLAYGSSFDQIGLLGHSVNDIAKVLSVIAGPDEFDSTASTQPVDNYADIIASSRPRRIAYLKAAVNHPSLDPEVAQLTQAKIDDLRSKGHQVEGIEFDLLDYIIPAYYVLTTAEASTNLSRYDGIRFGYRSKAATDLQETYTKSRTEGFGTEVKRRIILGTFVLSSGYYDAYYSKAQQVRRLIQEQTFNIFKQYDFILMPAAPAPAWDIGATIDDPVANYLQDIFTVQANMTGIPAIALPMGHHQSGLPFGIQLMSNKFKEKELLTFAKQIMTE